MDIFELSLPGGHSVYLQGNMRADQIQDVQNLANTLCCTKSQCATEMGRSDIVRTFCDINKALHGIRLSVVENPRSSFVRHVFKM